MKALWTSMALFGLAFAVWLVLDTDGRTDLSPHTHSFLLDEKGDRLMLDYIAGEGLPSQDTRVLVTLANERTALGAHGAGLGDQWDPGESVCIAGSGCMVSGGDLRVQVEYGSSVLFDGTRSF